MATEVAQILLPVPNSGIVQMPDRRLPGIVIQGDSLSQLFDDLVCGLRQAKQHRDEEAYYSLLMCAQRMQDLLTAYEEALKQSGLDLPYMVSIKTRLVADDFAA